jgi:hypothetical protein
MLLLIEFLGFSDLVLEVTVRDIGKSPIIRWNSIWTSIAIELIVVILIRFLKGWGCFTLIQSLVLVDTFAVFIWVCELLVTGGALSKSFIGSLSNHEGLVNGIGELKTIWPIIVWIFWESLVLHSLISNTLDSLLSLCLLLVYFLLKP